jgi:hypothetical protein
VGADTLRVIGTEGSDKLTLTAGTVVLEGAVAIDCEGFAHLHVELLGGDDTVTMTGINPNTETTIDGGAGRDRFVGRFGPGDVGNLNLLNFEQATIIGGRITLGPTAVRLVSDTDEEDEQAV